VQLIISRSEFTAKSDRECGKW